MIHAEQSGMAPVEYHRVATGKFRSAARNRILEYANAYQVSWRRVLTGPRSGRIYRHKGRSYQASAPGEPPAERSGALRNGGVVSFSYSETPGGWRYAFTHAVSGPAEVYAPLLRSGTSRMAPRPFEQPILDDAAPEFRRISYLRFGP